MKKKVSKKKTIAKKKSGRKFIKASVPQTTPAGEISGFNYYVKEDKRDFRGRPTKYSKDIIDLANKYLQKLPTDEPIHTIEGLSDYLMVSRDRIYEWCKDEDKRDFRDIVGAVMSKQSKTLIAKGLNKIFDSPITKLMLGKHGYVDRSVTDTRNTNMNELDPIEREKINNDLHDAFTG